MTFTLGELLEGIIQIKETDKDIEVNRICIDSRDVKPGDLFIFHKGDSFDPHAHYKSIEKDAVAFIAEKQLDTEIPTYIVPNTNDYLGQIAARFFAYPTASFTNIAITGTNGKTSTMKILADILRITDKNVADIGTNGIFFNNEEISVNEKTPTTPPPLELQTIAYQLKQKNTDYLLMETTSHGLHMGRTKAINYKYRVFTNLTKDHLDYHKTMDAYLAAKKILFDEASSDNYAIVNADSKYTDQIIRDTKAKVITYGLHEEADFKITQLTGAENKTDFTVQYNQQEIQFTSSLVGEYNILNLLTAIIIAYLEGVNLDDIKVAVKNFKGIKGRLERVENSNIFIDYAHTPDALENVLKTLKAVTNGKLLLVFGAGGDRDRSKRAEMGKIAEVNSDLAIITSDNPRTENPSQIINDIKAGMTRVDYAIEDREAAIKQAINLMKAEDVLVIAGKGQEEYQEINQKKYPFSDYQVALKYI